MVLQGDSERFFRLSLESEAKFWPQLNGINHDSPRDTSNPNYLHVTWAFRKCKTTEDLFVNPHLVNKLKRTEMSFLLPPLPAPLREASAAPASHRWARSTLLQREQKIHRAHRLCWWARLFAAIKEKKTQNQEWNLLSSLFPALLIPGQRSFTKQ